MFSIFCSLTLRPLNEGADISYLTFSLFPEANISKINFANCFCSQPGATQSTQKPQNRKGFFLKFKRNQKESCLQVSFVLCFQGCSVIFCHRLISEGFANVTSPFLLFLCSHSIFYKFQVYCFHYVCEKDCIFPQHPE